MNFPVVLVISNCSQTPAVDVIKNIRKTPNDDKIHKNDDDSGIFYIHDIDTKYYNTSIAFHPVDDIENLSEAVSNVEGVLVYFNSNDRSVLEVLPKYVDFIKNCQIEFCMMLCKELSDDDKTGVTFKCIKDCFNMLDIIELERASCDDGEDEENLFNPSGYDELAQALRSVIWSNVDVNHVSSNGKPSLVSNGTQNNHDDSSNEDLNVEAELENFEKLLSQMMQFRPASENMSREDRLNCAQGFAEVFEKLILQDEDLNDLDKD